MQNLKQILRNFDRNPFEMEVEEEEKRDETAVVPANVQPRREPRIPINETPVSWRRREESEVAVTPRFVEDDSEGRPRRRSRINRQLVRPRPLILDLVPPSPAEADGSITVTTPDRRPPVVLPMAPSMSRMRRLMERSNLQPIPFSLDSSPERMPVPEYTEYDLRTPQNVSNRFGVVQESSPMPQPMSAIRRRLLFGMSPSSSEVNNEVSTELLRTPEFASNGNMQTQVMSSTRHPTPASSRRRRREIKRLSEDTGVVPTLDSDNE